MGSLAALNTGAQWYNDSQQMQRQAERDAWTAKQNARTQLEWDQADRANAAGTSAMAGDMAPDAAFDARNHLGLAPAAPAAPVSDGSYAGDGPDIPTPQNTLAPAKPPAAPAAGNTFADGQRRDLEAQMRMAKEVGGQKGFAVWQAAKQELRKLKVAQDTAQISSGILNASEPEYAQVLTKLTADKRNEYEAVYDPKSKMTTLQLGSKKAELSRAQVADYFAASYRLAQGDASALADMEKINAGLASQVSHNLKNLSTVAERNNQAGHYTNQDENNAARLGLTGARGIGGAGGAGKTGKAPPTAIDVARDILKDSAPGSDAKPADRSDYAKAFGHLESIFKANPSMTAGQAAAMAADAAKADAASDPARITVQISDLDGTINKVYADPNHNDGHPVSLARNVMTRKDFEAKVGADGVQKAAASLLASMGSADKQAGFLRAAHDATYRAAMLAAAKEQGVDVDILSRKIDWLKALPAPVASGKTQDAAGPKPEARALKTSFGLGGADYAPPPGSPAAQAQAVRTQARGAQQAKTEQASQAQQALSAQFAADRQAMAPLELLRKYDGLRAKLSIQDAMTLKAAEQNL